jgi:hypothetical protein
VTWFAAHWPLCAISVVVVLEVNYLIWAHRRFRAMRDREAAAMFRADSPPVRQAAAMAREYDGIAMVSGPHAKGWAWIICQEVSRGDLLITTGWCRSRKALQGRFIAASAARERTHPPAR